jgi:hypothetical protein
MEIGRIFGLSLTPFQDHHAKALLSLKISVSWNVAQSKRLKAGNPDLRPKHSHS